MNIGKSTKIAMATAGITCEELYIQMGVTPGTISNWRRSKSQSGKVIEALAGHFNMSVSAFVALGEE